MHRVWACGVDGPACDTRSRARTGFERLEVPFDRHYVWFRRNPADHHPITEVCVTHGHEMPPFGHMRKLHGTSSYHLHYHKKQYAHEFRYQSHHKAAKPELLADVIRSKLRKHACMLAGGRNSTYPVSAGHARGFTCLPLRCGACVTHLVSALVCVCGARRPTSLACSTSSAAVRTGGRTGRWTA